MDLAAIRDKHDKERWVKLAEVVDRQRVMYKGSYRPAGTRKSSLSTIDQTEPARSSSNNHKFFHSRQHNSVYLNVSKFALHE